jgi:thiamine biosynthesis lipoprotein
MAVRLASTPALTLARSARAAALLVCLLAPQAVPAVEVRVASYVFGTVAQITVRADDAAGARAAVGEVFRELDRMHRELHAWKPGALVDLNAAIARGETDIPTTREIARLIVRSQRLAAESEGAFDPAVGRLVALWSFHRDAPGGAAALPDLAEIARLLRAHPSVTDLRVSGDRVTSANPLVQLDFGGYAKGYALDRAAQILRRRGVGNALINFGGNIMALGTADGRPWRAAIESPRGEGLLASVELGDGEAIGTSGDYRRYYEIGGRRYAHIIDPRTGYPVAGVESVTVLIAPGPDAGALSDAATKPIFIAGRAGWREAAARMGVSSAMLVDSDGTVHATPALRARLRGATVAVGE